ncbi:MAG: hypothetical protein NTX87_14720 [Planctomycetota bacterium]|nr:hypothetical protein [Planctomycetota bacterium]
MRLRVRDLWKMRDGDYVTLTNREADLPPWFTLHPLETANALAYKMMLKLKEGFHPGEPLDGPNLWRVLAGERVVWVGPDRSGQPSADGVLAIVDCHENVLVVGETNRPENSPLLFGELSEAHQSPEAVRLCRAGCQAVLRLGLPSVLPCDDKWTLG